MYVSTLSLSSDTPEEGIRFHYRWLWTTMWLLGIELRTSGRVVGALNCWAISPALPQTFLFLLLLHLCFLIFLIVFTLVLVKTASFTYENLLQQFIYDEQWDLSMIGCLIHVFSIYTYCELALLIFSVYWISIKIFM